MQETEARVRAARGMYKILAMGGEKSRRAVIDWARKLLRGSFYSYMVHLCMVTDAHLILQSWCQPVNLCRKISCGSTFGWRQTLHS